MAASQQSAKETLKVAKGVSITATGARILTEGMVVTEADLTGGAKALESLKKAKLVK